MKLHIKHPTDPVQLKAIVALLGSKQQQGLMLTIRTPLARRGPIFRNVPNAVVFPPNPRGPMLVAFTISVTFLSQLF